MEGASWTAQGLQGGEKGTLSRISQGIALSW